MSVKQGNCDWLITSELFVFVCRQEEAWESEFWPPCCAEAILQLLRQLAHKACWLPEGEDRRLYAATVPLVHSWLSHFQSLSKQDRYPCHLVCRSLNGLTSVLVNITPNSNLSEQEGVNACRGISLTLFCQETGSKDRLSVYAGSAGHSHMLDIATSQKMLDMHY